MAVVVVVSSAATVSFLSSFFFLEMADLIREREEVCDYPTNIASVNLVMGCSKASFLHYSNTCPGVLTLY